MTSKSFVFAAAAVMLCSACAQTTATPAAAPAASAGKKTCAIVRSKPGTADTLLAAKSYKEAEATFRENLKKDPASLDDRLGIVLSLIGEDKVVEAQAEASAMLAANPQSAVAEVAMNQVAYRAADMTGSSEHVKKALALDNCEGRAFAAVADLFDINGQHATAAKFLRNAHLLRPNDELITRDWIDSLPRKQRQAELDKYLDSKPALSADDARGYGNELQHLKARRPNECHISSKTDVVKTGMQPVYGDSTHPEAFGLDVNFDGKRRRMQIDTGASGILLTQSAARGLGLQPEFKLKTGGIGDDGDVESYLSHVHSIRIGDVVIEDCMVEVVKKSKLDVDGLIGMDVFSRWLVTLDYQNAMLRLAPLPARPGEAATKKLDSDPLLNDQGDEESMPHDTYVAPEMHDWISILRIGHQIMLPARLNTGPTHWLIMDTGASASSLSVAFGKEAGKLDSSNVEFMGLSGKVKKVYETKSAALRVGPLQLTPTTYFAYDFTNISHDNGFETSGLFGLPTLQRLTIQIDYRDNLLKLTYDPNKDVQRF